MDDEFVIKWNDFWHLLKPSPVHPQVLEVGSVADRPVRWKARTFNTRKEAIAYLERNKE